MLFEKIKAQFPGLKKDESLKNHSTFRVGGAADFFYELFNIEELPPLVTMAEENHVPYKFIGRGTNTLFTDKGFRGLIIKNLTKEMRVEGTTITADSGVLLSSIIRSAVENGLTGLEPLYGLPGSIGGAVWGNAGVPNCELKDFVKSVSLFTVSDGVREVPREEIDFQYRTTSLQKNRELVMRVILELKKGVPEESKNLMKEIDIIRRGKQPIGYTAGSFFKNPGPGNAREKKVGYLIEQVGLKGHQIGDAQISPKHANFFMNLGKATTADILQLAQLAQEKVREKFGTELEMEVKIIGEP